MRFLSYLLFAALGSVATAATYYVDFASGSDANAGTSEGAAWKHCPGDENATSTADAATLSAGDTIDFRRGVTYVAGVNGILLLWSGTNGSPITYTSSWGTGDVAIITTNNVVSDLDSTNGTARAFDDNGAARNYLVFDGLTIQDIGGTAVNAAILNGLESLSLSAATDTITKVAHGLTDGYRVRYHSGTGGFSQLTIQDVNYYARNVTADTFQLSLSTTGAIIDFASDGVGRLYVKEPPGGGGIDLVSGGVGITIENCTFNRVGTWQGGRPFGDTAAVTGTGVILANHSDTQVINCAFSRMKTGVSIKPIGTGCDGITITGCTFSHNMNWLIDVAPGGSGGTIIKDVVIDRCEFFDYAELDQTQWNANGGVFDSPHQDGIFLRTSGLGSTWSGCVIRNSLFWKDDTNTQGGTASIYVSQGPSVDIYNCVFKADKHADAHINIGYEKAGVTTQQVRVWNCSFYGGQTHIRCSPGNSNPDVYEVLNCAVYRSNSFSVVGISPATTGTLTHDYNVFYGGDANRFASVNTATNYKSLTQWQSEYGKDVNSVWADPLFTSTSGSPSTWSLVPATGSPLIDSGTDLSTHFTTDITGATRTGTWDIGAYETGATGGSAPSAPGAGSLTAIRNVGGTISWTDASDNEDGFEVDRSFDNSNWTQIATTAANVTSYTDAQAPAGRTCYYRVRAVNGAGDSTNATPTPASITTGAPAPVRRSKNSGAVRAGGGL